MRNIGYSIIAMLLMAEQAHAWGDENWNAPQPVTINVEIEPDYLQQRIETRRLRAQAQQGERKRMLHVMHENKKRVRVTASGEDE